MNKPRLVAAKTFFARMNEGRSEWLTEMQMLRACEEFFGQNGYKDINHDITFADHPDLVSPVMASNGVESIATMCRARLDKYDMRFFGMLESALYDLLDNHDKATLMLATDSLSYEPITKTEDIGIAIENLMDEGMYLLFVNGKLSHALFDDFRLLTVPVPVQN